MNNLENTQLGDNPKYYIEVTAQDRNRAAEVFNREAQLQLYIDKEASHRYVSDDLNMMITFLQRLADGHVELSDSNVGEYMDDMDADFELEEKKGRDMDDDGDIDSDDYLLTKDQAIKKAMKGKKIKKSQLKELVKRAISEQPMGMGGQVKGAVQLPKASNPADIKKLTDKGVDVKLAELELKHFDYTDEEGKMAMSDLLKISKYAIKLFNMLDPQTQLEGWVQAKLTKASDYLSSVFHYLEGEEILGEMEKTTNPNYPSNKNSAKLAFLKKERAQLMRDMEQEAEPEGGPIADEYGSKLNRIDKAIAQLKNQVNLEEVSAEYKPNTPAPEVGDLVGNTVQGFDHKVLAIQGDHYIVQNTVTGKKMKTFRDNMHKPTTMKEGLGNEIMNLEAFLIQLNQTLTYEKREGEGKDLKQIAFLEDWIEETKAKLKEKVAQHKQGINEANVPSNIAEFAKRKGVLSLVKTVAGWAEKVGKRITGGTAIGKNYDTLVLDMGYETADIYINLEDETIKLYNQPVNSFSEFKEVFMDEMTADEIEKDKNQFRREQGLEETYDGMYFVRVSPETFKRAVDVVNRNYPKANITIESPDTFRTKDIQTAEDLIMDFGVNDIELVQDNLNDFGDSQEMFDDIENYQENPGMYENKSTCCMRCGRKHVKGTSCPKPYLSKSNPRHCKNRK